MSTPVVATPSSRDVEIRLSIEDQSHYDALVSRFLAKSVKKYAKFGGDLAAHKDQWSTVRKRRNMTVYRRHKKNTDDDSNKASNSNTHVTTMLGTGTIDGSLEEVMDGLYCDNTDDLRVVKVLLKYKFVDGAVFYVSERRTSDAPYRFAGIKWTAGKAAWGLAQHRDLLTYERMGTVQSPNGEELAYHVLQSIDRPEWPADAIKGIKRARTATCYLYRQLPHQKNRVQCFLWGEFYNIGSVGRRVGEYVIAGTWLNVVRSADSAAAKKYTQMLAMSRSWPESLSCYICQVKPFLSTFPQCASCCETVCKHCASKRPIFKLDVRTLRPVEEWFCKKCGNETNSSYIIKSRSASQEQVVTLTPQRSESVFESTPKQRGLWDLTPHQQFLVDAMIVDEDVVTGVPYHGQAPYSVDPMVLGEKNKEADCFAQTVYRPVTTTMVSPEASTFPPPLREFARGEGKDRRGSSMLSMQSTVSSSGSYTEALNMGVSPSNSTITPIARNRAKTRFNNRSADYRNDRDGFLSDLYVGPVNI